MTAQTEADTSKSNKFGPMGCIRTILLPNLIIKGYTDWHFGETIHKFSSTRIQIARESYHVLFQVIKCTYQRKNIITLWSTIYQHTVPGYDS